MKKNRVRSLLALGLSLTMMVSIMGCGKQQRLDAEINPDTPVSDVQFPLKETEELSFITSAPATSTQDPNKRVIFQRMEEQTNVHIDWTCFVSDQFSDKKNLALAQFGNLPDGLFNAGMSDYDLLRYAKQGIIIPLENLIDKYMHRMDIFTLFRGLNSLVPEKKQFRPLEIFLILIRNGLIILVLRFQPQQTNWSRY